jgi:hypothetical protein
VMSSCKCFCVPYSFVQAGCSADLNPCLRVCCSFCEEKGLTQHVEVMKKGALLAQNPHDYDHISELTAEDKEAIDYEHAHKWSQPKSLYFTIFLCALGAATQGWDQTGSNGASEYGGRSSARVVERFASRA